MASVVLTRTTVLYPSAVFLQWDINADESGVHTVDIYRAGAPNGPWEQIASALPAAYNFTDSNFNAPAPTDPTAVREGLNLFSLSRDVYYVVTVTPPSGTVNAFSTDPTPIEPGLDKRTRLFKRKILRDESVAFRRLNGIQIVVLKRRHWGTRCPDCWDPVTKEGTLEHCSTCYGTTYIGGYWTPMLIRGRRTPGAVETNIGAHGNQEVKYVNFVVLDYPHLEYQDVIVDLRRNERFLVQRVAPTELKTVIVHQTCACSYIAHDAVEYEVPVDVEKTPPLY